MIEYSRPEYTESLLATFLYLHSIFTFTFYIYIHLRIIEEMMRLLGVEQRHPKWCWLGGFVLTCVIVLPFLYFESSPRNKATKQPRNRTKRSAGTGRPSDSCIDKYGGITLNYTRGTAMGFKFDLCSVINCGDKTLHLSLPSSWTGTWALVQLAVPLLGLRDTQASSSRKKRDMFDIGSDSTTYIDAIGVPRGVPDQYKLADQVAAGFENLPIISALFSITPNKNVDRINYVHYNVLRLANSTRDAVGGLSEQLAATSLMTIQNQIALDMLLAEKGGVCSMFQGLCCTFIPNNTAPDGSVTKALEGLRTLSEEMHEHSGIDNPIGRVFKQWFGKWKNLVGSAFLSLVGMLRVLALCGCCCIPCIRSLCERIIVTAVERKHPQPPPYQMTQMETATLLGEPPTDSDSDSEEDKV